MTRGWYVKSSEPFEDADALENFSWNGSASVSAGAVSTKYIDNAASYASDGTIFFGYVRDRPKGGLLVVR